MPLTSFGSFVASAVPASRGVNAGRADYLAGLRFVDEQDAILRERDFADLQRATPVNVNAAPGLTPPTAPGLFAGPRVGMVLPTEQVASPAAPADPAVFNQFMGTVAQQVNNPFALATIAAYGQRESSFSAQNAAGQWSDPSQSGQPGTSGGVMSWRNERLQALRQFAQQVGDNPMAPSAATQAQFFLNEDPMLVQRLNNAQSLEEANSIMANAWRFAGWDDPSPTGEAAARLATAQSFYSQLAGMIGTGEGASTSAAALGRPAPAGVTPPAAPVVPSAPSPYAGQPEVSIGSGMDLGAGFTEQPYTEAAAAAGLATGTPKPAPAPAPTPVPAIPVAASAPAPAKRKVPKEVQAILSKSPNAVNFELAQARRNAQYVRQMAEQQYQQLIVRRDNAMSTLTNARRVGDIERSARAMEEINAIDSSIYELDAKTQMAEQGSVDTVRKLTAEMAIQDLERRGDTRQMQQLWSDMGGLPVAIQPRSDGQYTVFVATPSGEPEGTVVSYEQLVSSFMEDLFGSQRDAAAASDAANVAQQIEAQLEIAKDASKQNAIGRTEILKILTEAELDPYKAPVEDPNTGVISIPSKDGSHIIRIKPEGTEIGPDGLRTPQVEVLQTGGAGLRLR